VAARVRAEGQLLFAYFSAEMSMDRDFREGTHAAVLKVLQLRQLAVDDALQSAHFLVRRLRDHRLVLPTMVHSAMNAAAQSQHRSREVSPPLAGSPDYDGDHSLDLKSLAGQRISFQIGKWLFAVRAIRLPLLEAIKEHVPVPAFEPLSVVYLDASRGRVSSGELGPWYPFKLVQASGEPLPPSSLAGTAVPTTITALNAQTSELVALGGMSKTPGSSAKGCRGAVFAAPVSQITPSSREGQPDVVEVGEVWPRFCFLNPSTCALPLSNPAYIHHLDHLVEAANSVYANYLA
jgi:hypothetical protein